MPFSFIAKSSYLSRKLLILILLVSSGITLLLTAVQLYLNFSREVSQVENQLNQIERGFLDSIAESVWDMDLHRLEIQLRGLTKLPSMHQVEVFDPTGKVIASVGNRPDKKIIIRSLDLAVNRYERREFLGHIEITASLEGAYSLLKDQVVVILISQGLKTFLVSGFILFIVNYLVIRHLAAMARYTSKLDVDNLDTPLVLDTPKKNGKDELDQVAQAINTMRENFLDDIKQRRKVEGELAYILDYLQDLFNSIPSVMISIDSRCFIVRWNSAAENLVGLGTDIEEGRKITEVIPFIEEHHDLIHHTMKQQVTRKDIHITVNCNDAECHLEMTVFPLTHKDVRGAVIRIDDITEKYEMAKEKRQLEQKLLEVQKMEAIGTLASGIAHDFNNILTAILGYGEMVILSLEPGSKVHANQKQVVKAAQRARELVKQILAFSRRTEQKRVPVQVYFIVKEAMKLLRPAIPSTISIKHNLDAECGSILADPTQIHQVVMNLCTNAYHAMREKGGELSIVLSKKKITEYDLTKSGLLPGAYVKLQIRDTGCGIEPAMLTKIFDPYFTTKKHGEGTGLGLAVVHGIVKSNDGYIFIESEPGKGTSFELYFPEIIQRTKQNGETDIDRVLGGNERIMVVDDQPEIVRIIEDIFTYYGYRVSCFSSSTEAFEQFKNNPGGVDLVITDMTMPEMTGVELAQKMLRLRADLPIVLCTGYSELINRQQAATVGIREYVMKPVGMAELGSVVRNLLDEASESAFF